MYSIRGLSWCHEDMMESWAVLGVKVFGLLALLVLQSEEICEVVMGTSITLPDVDFHALAIWGISEKTTPCSRLLACIALEVPLEKRKTCMHPTDGTVLGCCIALVRSVTGIRERLHALRFLSPAWNGIVDAWVELEAAYDQDLESKRQLDDRWAAAIAESNRLGEESQALQDLEELPEPKSALQRCLWVVLETYGGDSYKGLVAAYDEAPDGYIDDDLADLGEEDLDDDEDEDDESDDLLE